MAVEVEKIFLSKDLHSTINEDDDKTSTDVIVHLNNGEKYVAAFFTFSKINAQRLDHVKSGEYLGGNFFWEKNMIMIDSCSENNIRSVIQHLIIDGDFLEVFEKL